MARCDPAEPGWTVIEPVPPTAIRIARQLKALDVIEVLSNLFGFRGVPGHLPSDNGPECVAETDLD